MSILPIIKYGDPVLRKKALPVDPKDPALAKLAQDMFETMKLARGVGLAGNQVGVLKQITVIDASCGGKKEDLRVLLNPVMVETKGEVELEEGCLSFPDIRGVVVRAARCRVRAKGLDGVEFEIEGEGSLAECLQHETDHLQGILFVDRMRLASKTLVSGRLKDLRAETRLEAKHKGRA